MNLALFPLPIFLLPGGKTRLRIFEPRYLRLLSESLLHGKGFVICLAINNNEFYPLASRVEIYDFQQDQQGVLTIDVQAIERVEVGVYTVQADGLKQAQVTVLPHWENHSLTEPQQFMATILREYLIVHPLYRDSLNEQNLSNLTWVCQRWLELLPVDDSKKYWLAKQPNCYACVDFISEVISRDVL